MWKILTQYKEVVEMELEAADGSVYRVDDTFTALYFNATQHFGKGKRAAPYAKADNGLMEVYGLRGNTSRGSLLAILQQLPSGAHHNHPEAAYWQARRCTVKFSGPGCFNVDGEVMRHDGTITMAVRKQQLPVFAQRDSYAMNA